MKVTRTYPRLLVRWRGGRWEWHVLLSVQKPSDGTLIFTSGTSRWEDELAWLDWWRRQDELVKQMAVMNLRYRLERRYKISDGFTLTTMPSPRTAWGAGGMHWHRKPGGAR